jgi:hypothetical protein
MDVHPGMNARFDSARGDAHSTAEQTGGYIRLRRISGVQKRTHIRSVWHLNEPACLEDPLHGQSQADYGLGA